MTRRALESALPHRLARRRVRAYLLVAPFVFRVDTELATILDPLEAAHAAWVPLSYLRDVDRHRLRSVPGVPPEILFPAVEMDGAPLWGFTYRLLSDWLGLEANGRPADDVLQFLLERGLTLVRDWNGRVAEVRGTIPVDDVLARFCGPGPQALSINRLEARRGSRAPVRSRVRGVRDSRGLAAYSERSVTVGSTRAARSAGI